MTENDLERIADAPGHPLPSVFKEVMLKFPQSLIDAATMTDPEGNEFVDSMMITPNADYIIRGIEVREVESDWPNSMVGVGDNGCGDEFNVDMSEESCPVYMSGPHNDAMASGPAEEGYFEKISDDLRGWVAALADRAS